MNDIKADYLYLFNSIQRRIARFDYDSVANYLIYLDYLSMTLFEKNDEINYVREYKIHPWYIQPLFTIFLLTKFTNRPNSLNVDKDKRAFEVIIDELVNGELLLIKEKNDIFVKIPRFANIQDSYRNKNFPFYYYHYYHLMQDAEAKEWFKNTFNCDYYDILLLDVTIRMTIVGYTLKGNNAIDIKNAVKIINYLLKKYDNIYKQNYITYEEFYERQIKILEKRNYNFYSMPLVITKNPFVLKNDKIIVYPNNILSFIHSKIDDYYKSINDGFDYGIKLEEHFWDLFKDYKYATKKWHNIKSGRKELFDLALSNDRILVCFDIKAVEVFNNIYEDDNENIINKIYKYIIQRLKSIRTIVNKNIKFDSLSFSKYDIFSLIVFKNDQCISKEYLFTKIELKMRLDGYEDMIEYFKTNLYIVDYDFLYEFTICDSNIFDSILNRESDGYLIYKRLSEDINVVYDNWYSKLTKDSEKLLIDTYNAIFNNK